MTSGASGEVVEGPSRKDLAVGGRCVLSAAKDDVWRGWWSSACMRRARAARAGGLGARGWADQITKKGPWIDGLPVVARQDGDRPTHCAKKNRYSKIAIQKCQTAIQKSDVATQISTDPYKNTDKDREKVTKLLIAPSHQIRCAQPRPTSWNN